ncbi:MAG: hypothetical protein ABW098_12330 [Candidatus Thiodiazotropha sp.]
MNVVKGGCHCGNISYIATFPKDLHAYTPRACDCKLCTSHGAVYASDKNGTLVIKIKNETEVSRYRQGSRIADFLICKNCGIMTGVCYQEAGCTYGSINIRSSDEYGLFKDDQAMHLTQLDDAERIKRWKDNWFSCVAIEYESP